MYVPLLYKGEKDSMIIPSKVYNVLLLLIFTTILLLLRRI